MSITLALSRHYRIANIDVYLAPLTVLDPDKVLPVLREALELLARANPRPRPLLTGYIKRIFVDYYLAPRGQWFGSLALCLLNGEFLGKPTTTPLEVASILVHEGQHARLERCGVALTTGNHVRTERLCLRVERDFVSTQPGSERLLHDLQLLDRDAETVWDRSRTAALQHDSLRRAGIPEWMLRLVRRR